MVGLIHSAECDIMPNSALIDIHMINAATRIVEVPIELAKVDKPWRIAWFHPPQVWYVLRWLLTGELGDGWG